MTHTHKFLPTSTVITSHSNADFDALAAMIAAGRLYPHAAIIFPGSQEKIVRNFFIHNTTTLFNFCSVRDIDPTSVQRIVLVDTRQRSRLTHVQHLLEKPGVEIYAYDHHPDSNEDIPYTHGIIKFWGSTTAILTSELQARGEQLSPNEATILGLGIFEDTGSFTFISTTEHDFAAAAWLKMQQMDLAVITELLHRNLTTEQISILNTLLESATTHEINGVSVVIGEASVDHYVGDFALLTHKMMEMEKIRILFALGLMQDRIHVVARSRMPNVDVGQICTSMGGGGHAYAASATIKNRTLSQVKDELFALLYSHINPQLLVRELMSRPAVSVPTTATINQAVEIMTRYGFKSLPVIKEDSGCYAGILDRPIADRAHTHGLGHIAVTEYMQRDYAVINSESDLYPIMEIIVGKLQRLVPIVENCRVVGIITRTDLINTLIEEPARIPKTLLPEKQRKRNVRTLLREQLPYRHHALLEQAGQLAERLGFEVYAVGGFVRDILLRRPNLDLDLVVEGDAIAFAQALADELNGRLRAHHKFKTAIVLFKNHFTAHLERVDVATARLEYYEYPAALPTVELSSIKMDLYRRDFTVNALAVHLNPNQFGQLVDFFGAQRDIKDHIIRVLHSLSFVEDPTRILRAVRFEQRFGFRIGQQTERLIKNALQLELIQKLSGARLLHELQLILEEGKPLACLRRLQQLRILEAIHPALSQAMTQEIRLDEIERVLHWYRLLYLEPRPRIWLVYLLGLTRSMPREKLPVIVKRLHLSSKFEHELMSIRAAIDTMEDRLSWGTHNGIEHAKLYNMLQPIAVEGVLLLMAQTQNETVRKAISYYLTRLKDLRIEITGDDLLAMGVPPGPIVGEFLRHILNARLNGHAPTLLAQHAIAHQLVRKLGSGYILAPPTRNDTRPSLHSPKQAVPLSENQVVKN